MIHDVLEPHGSDGKAFQDDPASKYFDFSLLCLATRIFFIVVTVVLKGYCGDKEDGIEG